MHPEVAAPVQTLEEVEVEEVDLVVEAAVLEVRSAINTYCATKLIVVIGRGGFQQRDNGPPADVLGTDAISPGSSPEIPCMTNFHRRNGILSSRLRRRDSLRIH